MKILTLITCLALSSCGGTFTLRPDGSLAYTTPEILKPAVLREK